RSMAVVAMFNGIVLIIFGLPLIQRAITNPSRYVMQFGEFLTVPAAIALPVTLVLVLAPAVLGVWWSLRRLHGIGDTATAPAA
ncbi:MAG TPA: hypothetical protein VLI71_00045, partial [Gammaproteobacteria bacterium]|nr:hypothetical protein [Gammaproteobacteria bacterium]